MWAVGVVSELLLQIRRRRVHCGVELGWEFHDGKSNLSPTVSVLKQSANRGMIGAAVVKEESPLFAQNPAFRFRITRP
jgi:hypothetical protein